MTIDRIFFTPALAGCVCNPITTLYWENATVAVPLIVPTLTYNQGAACAAQFTGHVVRVFNA